MSTLGDPSLASPPLAEKSLYGREFFLAYLANVLLVTGSALTFRFAEFVAYLRGSETLAGEIISLGLIVSLVARFWLGQAIDRFGPRRIWLFASLLFLVGSLLFPVTDHFSTPGKVSPLLWWARVVYQLGVAGMFACSMVHIQNLAPPWRRTELIGSLGTSGFVGQIVGTQLGDLIFGLTPVGATRFYVLFWTVLLCGIGHLFTVLELTRRETHERAEETPGALVLFRRYWPGSVCLVAMAMGVNLAVTTVFLTRFATALNLRGIGVFFAAFSITAFACRWGFRSWAGRYGRHSMILCGLGGLGLGQLLLIPVRAEWQFVFPAMCCGFGHALLFPAVVSMGSGKFPVQYRGTGTTLVLGCMDSGMILAAPILGRIIDSGRNLASGTESLVGFVTMFQVSSAFVFGSLLFYACTGARRPDVDLPSPGVG
jgi:MFS family permease